MFKRLMNIIRGFFGLFISGLEANNPEALIESEKENLRSQIGRFNENLANHAGFVEKLSRTIKNLQAKERELTAKITANIKANNQKVAGQLAMQLQSVKQQLADNQSQFEIAEKTFKDLSKSRDIAVKEAQAKISKLETMVSETRMHEAQAELQEMAKGMISGIGSSGDSISRVSSLLEEKRDKAIGRSRVATTAGVDSTDQIMKEAEMEAMGDAALAEFMAMNGMASPSVPESIDVEPVSVPDRGMGNIEQN
ncbi:MAG: PspA/IM30 family protein [Candidatus Riflebacteria bacterium]|nr:PspA/IM30 family protein [Candidatus Riflebacteria bacterium]